MDASLRKIYLLILLIIVLPSLIFAIYEIGSLQDNEKVIEEIYTNQLDAILYSVNQYSEDVVSSWANRIDNDQDKQGEPQSSLEMIYREMPSVDAIVQYDSLLNEITRVSKIDIAPATYQQVNALLQDKPEIIRRLLTYIKSGYRKIEAFDLNEDEQLLIFVTTYHQQPIINVLMLDSEAFITTVLDPKIQEIAGERFYISAFFKSDDQLVYSSDKQYFPEEVEHQKTFWVLDDYYLGIEMKDKKISDLAAERSRKDLMMIGAIEIVLLVGVFLIFRNVRKQMELAQIKSDFVSNVSHEIRTPLALISMYVETLESGKVKAAEKIHEYYSIVLQETQRLTAIVNKILNFSQLESGKRKFSFEQVDLKEVVQNVVNTFKLNLEFKDFAWDVECEAEQLQIIADREAVTDVIVNLIDNAIKYSGETKKIEIECRRSAVEFMVEIRDHGIGISKAEQKHIFDKFYRVTSENLAHKAKGSGVGLSIVKQIVEAHEGRITVKSKPGEGSSFRLYFPVMKTSIP